MTDEVPVMGMEEQAQVRLIQDKTTSKKLIFNSFMKFLGSFKTKRSYVPISDRKP